MSLYQGSIRKGSIDRNLFSEEHKYPFTWPLSAEGYCFHSATIEMLSIPLNYTVREIPSGCCGMAGSFGYEKEHFDLSNKIGEMVLFPGGQKID